jgi:hypothetical protein
MTNRAYGEHRGFHPCSETFRDGDRDPRASRRTYAGRVPPHIEGRFAIVTMRGAGCGGAAASGRSEGRRAQVRIEGTHPQGRARHPEACERRERRRTDHAVHGQVAWRHVAASCVRAGPSRVVLRNPVCPVRFRPEAAASAETTASACGRCRGEHEASWSTTACGTPDLSGVTVVTTLVCLFSLRTRLRMRWRIRRSARPHRRAGMQSALGAPAPSQQQGR